MVFSSSANRAGSVGFTHRFMFQAVLSQLTQRIAELEAKELDRKEQEDTRFMFSTLTFFHLGHRGWFSDRLCQYITSLLLGIPG
jgi:hypothetical protein